MTEAEKDEYFEELLDEQDGAANSDGGTSRVRVKNPKNSVRRHRRRERVQQVKRSADISKTEFDGHKKRRRIEGFDLQRMTADFDKETGRVCRDQTNREGPTSNAGATSRVEPTVPYGSDGKRQFPARELGRSSQSGITAVTRSTSKATVPSTLPPLNDPKEILTKIIELADEDFCQWDGNEFWSLKLTMEAEVKAFHATLTKGRESPEKSACLRSGQVS